MVEESTAEDQSVVEHEGADEKRLPVAIKSIMELFTADKDKLPMDMHDHDRAVEHRTMIMILAH